MGRERPELWADTARSIERAGQRLPQGWSLQWCIHLDGIDESMLTSCAWWSDLTVDTTVSAGERRGISMARNEALVHADGQLIGVVDDDDRLGDGWAEMVKTLAHRPDVGWVAGRSADIDLAGQYIDRGQFPLPYGDVAPGDPGRHFLATGEWQWHCCAAMTRADLVHAVGGWAALPWCEDISMWSAITTHARGVYLDVVVYEWRQHLERSTHTGARKAGLSVGTRAARTRAASALRLDEASRSQSHKRSAGQ